MILVVTLEQFRSLLSSQIESADLIIIDQGETAHIYKNRYDRVQMYNTSWNTASRLIINTLSKRHSIHLPDLKLVSV